MAMKKLDDVKTFKDYKNNLKEALKKNWDSPLDFHFFNSFKFEEMTVPMLFIGKISSSDLAAIVKEGGAVTAKGTCTKSKDGVQFEFEGTEVPITKLNDTFKQAGSTVSAVFEPINDQQGLMDHPDARDFFIMLAKDSNAKAMKVSKSVVAELAKAWPKDFTKIVKLCPPEAEQLKLLLEKLVATAEAKEKSPVKKA